MTTVLLIGTGTLLLGFSITAAMSAGYLYAEGREKESKYLRVAANVLVYFGGWLIYVGGAL